MWIDSLNMSQHSANMSRWLYPLVLFVARPFVHLRLRLRARKEPEYGVRIEERFGHVPEAISKKPIWFHTVSAGETLAAVATIRALKAQFPSLPFLVTTMTPTGSQQVQERLGEEVEHCYAPYDFGSAVKRFYNRVEPRVLVLMETELWPNLIGEAHARKVPVLLMNGRLSDRSAKGYSRVDGLTRKMLQSMDLIACQTRDHRDRFIGLGAVPERVKVTGSVKYDVSLDEEEIADRARLAERFAMGGDDPVWIAASTHPGEDEIVIEAMLALKTRVPDLRMILVPRHPARTDDVLAILEARGLTYARQSEAESAVDKSAEVIVGDVMGTLLKLYGLARVAFVGGSLVDVGGHNPIEPALWGIPFASGPYQYNFADVMDAFAGVQAMRTVTSADDLTQVLGEWLSSEALLSSAGEAATQVVMSNRGAQARVEELLGGLITRALQTD